VLRKPEAVEFAEVVAIGVDDPVLEGGAVTDGVVDWLALEVMVPEAVDEAEALAVARPEAVMDDEAE
jgi:hypothetical protein